MSVGTSYTVARALFHIRGRNGNLPSVSFGALMWAISTWAILIGAILGWLTGPLQAQFAEGSSPTADSQSALTGGPLPRILAGTIAQDSTADRWNRLVLLAQPSLSSGDVDAIPSMIRDLVGSFVLTLMATVERYREPATGEEKHRLREVGAGFSAFINGQLIVIDSASQDQLGADLGFIGKRMLESNERQLGRTRVIAKTSTLLIFDVPAILFRSGEHRDFVMRHFLWIDSRTGRCSSLVWLIAEDEQQRQNAAVESIRWVPAGTREDRKIHVDSSQFVLGLIPPDSAFALEDLPPGKEVPWSDSARQLAAKSSYDLEELRELTIALNLALQNLR